MRKIKTLRNTKGARDQKIRPMTTGDTMNQRVPPHTSRNIKYGHLIRAMRDINHIEWEPWEQVVVEMQRIGEKQRFEKNNRFYNALEKTHALLGQVRKSEQDLQAINEEMEATNEELQATNEEMEATNEELQATSEELRMAGAYTRSLIEASLDALVTIGTDGKITDVNSETEAITGYSRQELIGSDFSNYFREPDKAREGYSEAFKEGSVRDYPLELQHRNGHVTPVLYNASVYHDNTGTVQGVFAAARDIAEQKKAEENLQKLLDELRGSQAQLIQAGKMSAMGTMTAGIAHELNNPMMGILNFIQYCLKYTSEDDRRYSVLQDAERETKRSSAIIQNLLTFSRMDQEGEEEYEKESLVSIFDRVFNLLSYRVEKENVLVTRNTSQGTPPIWMKTNNIQQVAFNLISNALDAIEKRDKKEIHVDLRPEGEFVQMTVADTGCGISPENLQRVFDPFFTTKPVGKGTGLGLSICHSIVTSHGGEIICESESGIGTKFKVLLPIEKERRKQNGKTHLSD